MNIFKEMIKDLPLPKNKIIANDPIDDHIAKQFSDLINWEQAQRRIDYTKKLG